ncbi:hypothetical protein [Stackebrandtia nassauensis]|uniref:Transmembrane protein n=1 Tax=Stackebrandtia nassauensis (strain DSM 44728 / CIP 108903 / NRRL B-16338 / NBRC 102104 / LLR-40K-21) TaxID=446470 RepID=D3Q451_STANL|nr:hypothetical protein [Stackebrandtia nassauensis]ADD45936.1 hypothetical protein Snas_6318 [Stackebrandtia nassauensis DSM 44728]
MPTSVLLAILAGAGLLALAPALVRRYDADERIAADRENSRARVLDRDGGKNRDNPPDSSASVHQEPDADAESATLDELLTQDSSDSESALRTETPTAEAQPEKPSRRRAWERRGVRRAESVVLSSERQIKGQEVPVASALRAWWQRRYRKVLYVLLALNFAELLGVIFLGPGFWIGAAISLTLLVLYLRFLRVRARRQQRRRLPAVRVPAQSTDEPDEEISDDAEYESEYAEESEATDEPAVPVAEAPSRRRTGGIRGRSYESPANL